jgi:hypothetical protein
MKNSISKIYAIFFLLMVSGFVSCKKSFLEVDPKGKLIAKNANDYNLMLNNAFFNVETDGQIFMGDDVVSAQPYYDNMSTTRVKRYFQYADVIYEPNEDGTEFKSLMSSLYVYNVIINEVMGSEGGTDDLKKSYRAEALTNRAWVYFMLINYYGKPYNEATAATDPGFPIITTADVTNNKFERASVKAVYDFIVEDLQTAIPSLPISAGNRTRVSKSTAEALLAKVYLFMGKYKDGLGQINNAFSNLPVNYQVKLYDYNIMLTIGGEWGYNPVLTPMTYLLGVSGIPDNLEVLMAKQYPNLYTSFINDILVSPKVVGLYGPKDLRLRLLGQYLGGSAIKGGAMRRIGPYATQMGMSMPDMYLMKAEMKARTGDVAGASTDLKTFRENRMPVADAGVNITDQTAMIKFIIDERIREFAVQGYRWFDMRRLSVDPIFAADTYSHQVLSATGVVEATFPLKPERLTLRLPAKVINANPGMVNNP